jgi:hypothetical protein
VSYYISAAWTIASVLAFVMTLVFLFMPGRMAPILSLPIGLIAAVAASWFGIEFSKHGRAKLDRDLAEVQLRKVYDLASRLEDVGPSLDFWASYELNMVLRTAQYFLFLVEHRGGTNEKAVAGLRSLPKEPHAEEKQTPAPASIGDLSVASER